MGTGHSARVCLWTVAIWKVRLARRNTVRCQDCQGNERLTCLPSRYREVIGIHNAAIASAGISTTSLAIPLVQEVVAEWLEGFDESPESDQLDATVSEAQDA